MRQSNGTPPLMDLSCILNPRALLAAVILDGARLIGKSLDNAKRVQSSAMTDDIGWGVRDDDRSIGKKKEHDIMFNAFLDSKDFTPQQQAPRPRPLAIPRIPQRRPLTRRICFRRVHTSMILRTMLHC